MPDPLKDFLYSALFLGFLVLQATVIGYLLSGWLGALFVLLLGGVFAGAARAPVRMVLRMLGARVLRRGELWQLQRLVGQLARRAGLARAPVVALIPSDVPNAMALGSTAQPVIGITRGMLRRLSAREVAGVLAHEISHIAHGDLRRMAIAQAFARFTSTGGQIGALLLLVGALIGQPQLGLVGLALLPGPLIAQLVLLALSRRREFAADTLAARITGDPAALATALRRIEVQTSALQRLVGLPSGLQPALLRTHPATEARVARLQAMVA